MENILTEIKELAAIEGKTLEQMALKLSEESGEVAQAILAFTNAGGSKYKDFTKEDAQEECIDTVLVALALFFKLSDNSDPETEFLTILARKKAKWIKHIQ